MGVSNDQCDSRNFRSQVDQCLLTGLYEILTQKPVFRRITTQCHCRCNNKIGACFPGLLAGVQDFKRIAIQVSHCTVELCNGYFHGEWVPLGEAAVRSERKFRIGLGLQDDSTEVLLDAFQGNLIIRLETQYGDRCGIGGTNQTESVLVFHP